MTRERAVLAAASVRIVLGVFALTLLPTLYPGTEAHAGIFAAYIAVSTVLFVLILRRIGGMPRAIVGGIIDLLILTLIVHRVGSVVTMLVALYFFACIVNTLVVGRRVGIMLSVLGALLYAGVVFGEHLGWLPYGPDAPPWATGETPTGTVALFAALLMAILLLFSTAVVGMLVHSNRARERELEELSQRDPLTKLYNRRHLLARIEQELLRVKRGHPLSLVMIDLDKFKRINDREGHLRGDALLEELGVALQASTRETDVAGRYGGDEFVVVLPDTDQAQAEAAAERIVTAVREVGVRFDPDQPVTASVGVAFADRDDEPRKLIRRADSNAYLAKEEGGDRVSSVAREDRGA